MTDSVIRLPAFSQQDIQTWYERLQSCDQRDGHQDGRFGKKTLAIADLATLPHYASLFPVTDETALTDRAERFYEFLRRVDTNKHRQKKSLEEIDRTEWGCYVARKAALTTIGGEMACLPEGTLKLWGANRESVRRYTLTAPILDAELPLFLTDNDLIPRAAVEKRLAEPERVGDWFIHAIGILGHRLDINSQSIQLIPIINATHYDFKNANGLTLLATPAHEYGHFLAATLGFSDCGYYLDSAFSSLEEIADQLEKKEGLKTYLEELAVHGAVIDAMADNGPLVVQFRRWLSNPQLTTQLNDGFGIALFGKSTPAISELLAKERAADAVMVLTYLTQLKKEGLTLDQVGLVAQHCLPPAAREFILATLRQTSCSDKDRLWFNTALSGPSRYCAATLQPEKTLPQDPLSLTITQSRLSTGNGTIFAIQTAFPATRLSSFSRDIVPVKGKKGNAATDYSAMLNLQTTVAIVDSSGRIIASDQVITPDACIGSIFSKRPNAVFEVGLYPTVPAGSISDGELVTIRLLVQDCREPSRQLAISESVSYRSFNSPQLMMSDIQLLTTNTLPSMAGAVSKQATGNRLRFSWEVYQATALPETNELPHGVIQLKDSRGEILRLSAFKIEQPNDYLQYQGLFDLGERRDPSYPSQIEWAEIPPGAYQLEVVLYDATRLIDDKPVGRDVLRTVPIKIVP